MNNNSPWLLPRGFCLSTESNHASKICYIFTAGASPCPTMNPNSANRQIFILLFYFYTLSYASKDPLFSSENKGQKADFINKTHPAVYIIINALQKKQGGCPHH